MKLSNFKQYFNLMLCDLKTSFWQLWQQSLKSATLVLIFLKNTTFYPEL